jgi:hypothetical protein
VLSCGGDKPYNGLIPSSVSPTTYLNGLVFQEFILNWYRLEDFVRKS